MIEYATWQQLEDDGTERIASAIARGTDRWCRRTSSLSQPAAKFAELPVEALRFFPERPVAGVGGGRYGRIG